MNVLGIQIGDKPINHPPFTLRGRDKYGSPYNLTSDDIHRLKRLTGPLTEWKIRNAHGQVVEEKKA